MAENPNPVARQSPVAVSDKSLELSQDAAPCAYAVSPNTDVVGAEGGTLTIDVRDECGLFMDGEHRCPVGDAEP